MCADELRACDFGLRMYANDLWACANDLRMCCDELRAIYFRLLMRRNDWRVCRSARVGRGMWRFGADGLLQHRCGTRAQKLDTGV